MSDGASTATRSTTSRTETGSLPVDQPRDGSATRDRVADNTSSIPHPTTPPPNNTQAEGEAIATVENEKVDKPDNTTRLWNSILRFGVHAKDVLFYSKLNILLVFVPIGIAVNFATDSPEIIFAMNAVAVVPLAGLLAHATESVASRLGDTVVALLNVTFGNAVELIIL